MTHVSYPKVKEANTNSRYTFLGMFAVKGMVAELLHKYKVGNGMQLQHTLGNMFSNARLEELFDKWRLMKYVRYGSDFSIDTHKHIFVFAMLGYIYAHYSQKDIYTYLLENFLPDEALIAHDQKRFNIKAAMMLLVQQHENQIPKVITNYDGVNYTTSISIKAKELISVVSKSKSYSIKSALSKVIKLYQKNTADIDDEKDKTRQEKAQKHQEWLIAQTAKRTNRLGKAKEREEEAIRKDIERRKSKAERKKKEEALLKKQKISDPSTMNASKRRFLEDKLK